MIKDLQAELAKLNKNQTSNINNNSHINNSHNNNNNTINAIVINNYGSENTDHITQNLHHKMGGKDETPST